jgi:hypothetical protein
MKEMILPNIIGGLIEAQNNHNSITFADYFSDVAIVFDEGNTYKGKNEIKQWIEKANEKYKTVMRPINFVEISTTSILTAEISGSFDGSPVLLDYCFEIVKDKINRLEIHVSNPQ